MIHKNISKAIITIGCDYKRTRGGMSTVLESYSNLYKPFRFISSSRCKGLCSNILDFTKAIILFSLRCCSPEIKIAHIHSASNNSFKRKSFFIHIAKFMNKKVVLHVHGGGFKEYLENNEKYVSKVLLKVDTLVVLSHTWQSYFKILYPHLKIKIVPNIVEEPISISTRNKADGCIKAIFLGLICEEKGIFDLMDVISKYKDYLKGKFNLYIGGNGDSERLCNEIVEYGIQDIVSYEGWIGKEEKARLLSISDVFVLPSYVEGVPISILEAMSYELPIISTNVGGIPEIVDNNINGYLFQPGNKEQLFNCINAFVENKEIKQSMGRESFKRVEPHLPQNVAVFLENIYKELL